MSEIERSRQKLRTGFTTGTCATAASKAALVSIISKTKLDSINVSLPKEKKITINIASCEFNEKKSRCSVIKDGGDDPDVTHGAEIFADLEITNKIGEIEIDGGYGVGRVTKPGLGLDVGSAAINPTPKKMMIENLIEVGNDVLQKYGIRVVISVPRGEEIGPKTDNPRLGIIGGISILGTTGIVIPYSTASFAASIRQILDVNVAMGNNTVVLTTGGRSEDFARKEIKLADHGFVQMGDFSGYTIQQCAKKSIRKVHVAGFIGKLTKIAMGVKQTHVKGSKVDMEFMARIAENCSADSEAVSDIKKANTARHVQEIIIKNEIGGFFTSICKHAYEQMSKQSENRVEIDVILFDFDGSILGRYP